jgi:imidazole glycerol phosphate synthase subunit HisF
MSAMTRAQEFLTDANDLTAHSVTKQFDIQREVVDGVLKANRERLEAFRNVKGLGDVVAIERRYYSAVAEEITGSVRAQSELARENLEQMRRIAGRLFGRDAVSKAKQSVNDAAKATANVAADVSASVRHAASNV